MRKYVLCATFLKIEIARIKSYIQRLRISSNNSQILTLPMSSFLNAALAIFHDPSFISQASPSLFHIVLANGIIAQIQNQVIGKTAYIKAADKAAIKKAAAEMQGRSYRQQFPRYVKRSTSSSPIMFNDISNYPDGNIPSFLLPLHTNISSLSHILPRQDGL